MEFKKWTLKIAVIVLLFAVSLSGLWYKNQIKYVSLTVDDDLVSIKTNKSKVSDVLDQQRIWLAPKDKVIPKEDTELYDGMEILVLRAFPVSVKVDGESLWFSSTGETVNELLERKEIPINSYDLVNYSLEDYFDENADIIISRVTFGQEVTTVAIPFQTEAKKNDRLEKGFTRILTKGKQGLKEITKVIEYHDGEEINRWIEEEKTLTNPVTQVVEQGTLDTIVTSRGETIRFSRAMIVEATAYDACFLCTGKNPGDRHYGITRSGIPVRPGLIAVDPRVIPLGTRIYIEGRGPALAADTGSAIKGNKIDIYMETHQEALRFGRRKIKIYILE